MKQEPQYRAVSEYEMEETTYPPTPEPTKIVYDRANIENIIKSLEAKKITSCAEIDAEIAMHQEILDKMDNLKVVARPKVAIETQEILDAGEQNKIVA